MSPKHPGDNGGSLLFIRTARAAGIPRGSGSLADYERGKRIVSELAHGDPAAYQQYLKVLVKYVGV